MISRILASTLSERARQYPVVTLTGPRQSGKTTLCRVTFPDKPYVNLESLDVREFAESDPRGFLKAHAEGAILDEIQRAPGLVSYLQAEVDADPRPGRFILTGSQQFEVMSSISQSLAGRTALLKLLPFSLEELPDDASRADLDRMLFTGFYPRIHDAGLDPAVALGDYVQTYVERDIRQLLAIKDLALFEKFVRLCAGRVGQLLNLQSLGNEVGISHTTVRNWLTLLEATYIVFLLQPWHVNLAKRQVKSAKLYFYDVGLAAWLMGCEQATHIRRHPLRGNLFENMIVIEALKYRYNRGKRNNLYFWRDAKGHEVDLLLEQGMEVAAVEIKSGATIHPDWWKGLWAFSGHFAAPPGFLALVYGGDERQQRSDASIWRATDVAPMLAAFEAGVNGV